MISKGYEFKYRIFNVNELSSAIEGSLRSIDLDPLNCKFLLTRTLADGSEEKRFVTLEDLSAVVDLRQEDVSGTFLGDFQFLLYYPDFGRGLIKLNVTASTGKQLSMFISTIRDLLGFEEYTPEQIQEKKLKAQTKKSLPLPDKVTIGWLKDHVSVSLWLWLIVVLGVVFLAGLIAGQTEFAKEILSGIGKWKAP